MAAPYEQEVILDADGQPIFTALDRVRQQLEGIQKLVAETGKLAGKGVADYGNILSNQAKEIQQSLSQIRALAAGKNSPGLAIQDLNANQRLAKATTAATEYGRGLITATTAAEALRAKLNQLNREIADRGRSGRGETLGQTKLRKNLEDQLTAIKRLDAELDKVQRKANRTVLGSSDRPGASAAAANLAAARSRLQGEALDPKRSSLTPEIAAYQKSLDAFDQYIAGIRTKTSQRLQDERSYYTAIEREELKARDTKALVAAEIAANTKKQIAEEAAAAQLSAEIRTKKALDEEAAWATRRKTLGEDVVSVHRAEVEKQKYLSDTKLIVDQQTQSWRRLTAVEAEGAAMVASQNLKLMGPRASAPMSTAGKTVFQGQLSAAAGQVRAQVQSGLTSPSTALIGTRFEQELRQAELQKALVSGEQAQITLGVQNLQIADAKVRAAERLVREDEKQIATQQKLNSTQTREGDQGRLALAEHYAREQIAALGPAQAIRTAKEATLAAETKLIKVQRDGTAEQLKQARVEHELAKAREKAVVRQGDNPLNHILSADYGAAAFARTAVYGAAAAAAYGLFNILSTGISTVVGLEDEFAKLQAIANADTTSMEALKASIFDVSETSRFATDSLIKISQTLAQAGVSADQMKSVLSSVTTLANASGSTPDEAVNLVTSAMGAFQLQASEAARVADLMTSALNRTKLTVGQTGQAIQYVGATAYEQNISLEQLLATVGAIAQAGVRSGSTIGTGFRQFLVDLQTPSEKLTDQLKKLGLTQQDVNVSTHGLSAVLETLKTAGFGSAQAYEGLETRAAAFYLTAKNNLDVMDQLQVSFADQGAATLANERAMNSLTAQWQRFKNMLTEITAGAGQGIVDFLRDALKGVSDLLQQYREYQSIKSNDGSRTAGQKASNIAVKTGNGALLGGALGGALGGGIGLLGFGAGAVPGAAIGATYGAQAGAGVGFFGSIHSELTKKSTAAEVDYAHAISDTSDKIATQSNLLGEVQKEYVRLLTQKDNLINHDTRSAAEMTNLMARFEGLSGYLTNTKNLYTDLTNAVQGFIGANQKALSSDIAVQQSNLRQQDISLTDKRGQLMGQVRGNKSFSLMSPQERAAIDSLRTTQPGTSAFTPLIGVIASASARLAGNANHIDATLNELANNMRAANIGGNQMGSLRIQRNNADAAATPEGSKVAFNLAQIEALVKTGEAAKLGTARTAIGATRDFIGSFKPKEQYKGYFNEALSSLDSFANQVTAILSPTTKELKAAEREAKLVKQRDLDAALKSLGLKFGRGHDESSAARARQNAMHAQGLTPATADTSSHTMHGGAARDINVTGMSQDQINNTVTATKARLKSLGIDAVVQYETGRGRNQGTGPHIHVNVRPGSRLGTSNAPGAQNNVDQYLDQKQLQLDQKDLADKLADMAKATSTSTFTEAAKAAAISLDKVNKDIESKAEKELSARGLVEGMPEWDVRMDQVKEETRQNVKDFQQNIVDGLVKSVEAATTVAEQAFKSAIAPAEYAKSLADARLSGLDYYSNNGKVPEYTKSLAKARSDQAQENLDRARSAALPAQISSSQSQLDRLTAGLSAVPQFDDKGNVTSAWTTATAAIEAQTEALRNLRTERDALDAALNASIQIPKTLSEGINQAVEAYKLAHNANNTFQQDLIVGMGGAVETAHGGLVTFFDDVRTGTKSVGQAFGDMVMSIINYLAQLVEQWLAMQILKQIFNLIGIGIGAGGGIGGGGGTVDASFGINPGFAYWGGKAEPKGYLGGGAVTNGSTAMDSVNARLARGEWVVNKRAVDSVGDGFMAQLNSHGSKALDQLGGMPQVIQAPKQNTNVYVVAPESKPTMSKNDVLVVMQDDMLNGESRKLIKSISQG